MSDLTSNHGGNDANSTTMLVVANPLGAISANLKVAKKLLSLKENEKVYCLAKIKKSLLFNKNGGLPASLQTVFFFLINTI